jgi:hypothetical protein
MREPYYDNRECEPKPEQLECHRCPVVCERVVYPAHCLQSGCRYVYAFDEGLHRYFGCLQKVFSVEIDLAPFQDSARRDVYGAVKAKRPPGPECLIRIEQAYRFRYSWQGCQNPTFLQHPDDYAPEAIRLIVEGPSPQRD